jgi:uncharacterized membrane protein YkvA (DUF1232 family)
MKKLTRVMLRKALKQFRGFIKEAKGYLKDKERLGYLLSDVVTMAKGRGGKLWEDIQLLDRLLQAWKSGSYKGVSVQTLVSIVAAILYFITPLDVIPDFIPGVGYIDDAAVIAWLISNISDDLDEFRSWEEGRREA